MKLMGRMSREAGSLSLGIDIGTHTVKALAAERIGDRLEIRGAGSFPMPPGLLSNGVVTNPKRLGRVLRAEIEEYGIALPHGIFSIPSALATLRWVSLPPLHGSERSKAARFKVKRHLPFSVDDAYVAASAPIHIGEGESGQSLVIALKREVIDSRAEALEIAGIEPGAAELEAQAILRVVERQLSAKSVLWRDASLTILDVGGSNTHMYVVQNQRLQFIRAVKFGSDVIAGAISKALGASMDEARVLLWEPHTELRPDGVMVVPVAGGTGVINVQPEMERLVREFLRLLRYFRSLHPERSYAGILDQVIACGGLVGLEGFTNYLQKELSIRVDRARPFAGTIAQLRRDTFQSVSNRQEAFTVVMGLALAGLKGPLATGGEDDARSEYCWTRAA